jgi:ABC-type glutathione transport system ATPase component
MMEHILILTNIRKYFAAGHAFFFKPKKVIKAVDNVSFYIRHGETFGLVGESGCGKTTLARIISGIIPFDSGELTLGGKCDMVFQDPFGSLNPRMNIFDIVTESLFIRGEERSLIQRRYNEVIEMVNMPARKIMPKFPHQFSGGQRQRIAIARAIIRHPELLILDEAVSSLDVSVQAGILNLLKDLQRDLGLSYLFISHDLRVVEFMSDNVGVMKDGRIIEIASKYDIYNNPGSEYTKNLLASVPEI